jgi:hypothetical protein
MMPGRFAWLGAGVVLLALGGVAAVATQDTWVDGYGIIAYLLVPLAFIPLAARRPRLSRHRAERCARLRVGCGYGCGHRGSRLRAYL